MVEPNQHGRISLYICWFTLGSALTSLIRCLLIPYDWHR
eukprot:UN18695